MDSAVELLQLTRAVPVAGRSYGIVKFEPSPFAANDAKSCVVLTHGQASFKLRKSKAIALLT
jgi:hypothetical protein